MPSSACDWSSDVCSSDRSEEHTSELQSRSDLVCRLLLEKKKKNNITNNFNSRKRSGMNTPLNEFNQPCTFAVTVGCSISKDAYNRSKSRSTAQCSKSCTS